MDPGLAAWLVPVLIGFSATWAYSLKLQSRHVMQNRQSPPSFINRPPGSSQVELFLGSAVPLSGAPLQYPQPLQKVLFNVNSLLQTFDGQEASINQNTGASQNPFLSYVAKGGASKQILSSSTPGNFVFTVRNKASSGSPDVSNFSFCLTCVKGSATVTLGNQTIQVPLAGNIPSSLFLKVVPSNVYPAVSEQSVTVTFTSVNTRVEVWLKEQDAVEVPLVSSAVIMPVMTSPVLSLEPDLGATANQKSAGQSKTNQDIPPATLECDQDLYAWSRLQTNQNLLAKNISLRCDAVVKPKFFRIDLQYPKDIYDSIVNDGPFAEVTQVKTNAPIGVPSVFVDDVLQLMTTFYFDQTYTYGLRKFSKDTTDTVGPVKLSANDIKSLLFSSGQTSLQSFFVRNDSLNTLSIGVLSNGSDAPFWVSPTCTQSIALQENAITVLNLNVLSEVLLSDDIVVNNEDFCIEVVDLRNRQTLQKPVVETMTTAANDPTSQTNPLYPNIDARNYVEFPVTDKNISWLYLTPFNNLVSLKVTQSNGTSEWIKTSQGSLPLLKVPWKKNLQNAQEIVPVNLGIFNGSLLGAGVSSVVSDFTSYPKQSYGVTATNPYPITAGQLAQTFLNTSTNQGAEQCIDVQLNKLLLDFFQDDVGQGNLATWPPVNWSAPTSTNSNNPAQFQFQFVNRWNSSKQVYELQIVNSADPNDPLTQNFCPLVPLPNQGPLQVVSVSLDYSDQAPAEFRNDPRFLTSAKFFGLACNPHQPSKELVLGSGSLTFPGSSPAVVPQSWVPLPSLRLRKLDIENARSITNSPNVLSFTRNANKGRLWKYSSSDASLQNIYSNNDVYLSVLQDILSTVNVEGFQSTQACNQWTGNFSSVPKTVAKGSFTGPAIQLRQNYSKVPSLLDADQHVNMSQDASSPNSQGPQPASKLPRWVGYSQFGVRLSFDPQTEDFKAIQTGLQNQITTTPQVTPDAPQIVVNASNNKFQIEAFTQEGHLIGPITIPEGLYATTNAFALAVQSAIQAFTFDFENTHYTSSVSVTAVGNTLQFTNSSTDWTIVFNFSSSSFVNNTMLHDCAVLLGFLDKIQEVGTVANPLVSASVLLSPFQSVVSQFQNWNPITGSQSQLQSLAQMLANATASLFSQNPTTLIGGSLGGPNDPFPATNAINWSQPFAMAPCFISASDGIQSNSLLIFWAFLLFEAQGRYNPGVQILLDSTRQMFQICVDTSKMNITSLAGQDQLGFDALGLSLTEPSDVVPQAVPAQILCVNATNVIESNDNWILDKTQKVTESRYNKFTLGVFDECFASMRQQLFVREVVIRPNAIVLDTTGETAQAVLNTGPVNASWISTTALEVDTNQNLTIVVTSTSATQETNVLNASNANLNALDFGAVRAIGNVSAHQSATNFQGLMQNQIFSQLTLSEVAGTLLGFQKQSPIVTDPQQNWYQQQRKNSLRLSQWSSSEFQFPMYADGPSTLHPRNVIPLGLVQSQSATDQGQNIAPNAQTEMALYSQMFGSFTSPCPVQVSSIIPLANPQIEDSIVAGYSSNSIGNYLITPMNNIVCLEAKLTFGWSQDDPSLQVEKKGFLIRHQGLIKLYQGPQTDMPIQEIQPLYELPTGPVTFNGLSKVLQEAINAILVQFIEYQTSRQVVIGSSTNADNNAVFEIAFQDVVVPMQSPGLLAANPSIQTWSPVDNVPTLIQTTRILKIELQLSNATVSSFTGITNPQWANLDFRDRCNQSGLLFGIPFGKSSETFGQTNLLQGDTLSDVQYITNGFAGKCPQSPASQVWDTSFNQVPTNVYFMDGYALRPQQEFQSSDNLVLADKKVPVELTDYQVVLSESNPNVSFGINPPGVGPTVIAQDGILNAPTSSTQSGAWTGPNFAVIQDIFSLYNLSPSVLHNLADSHLTAGIYGTGSDLTAGPQGNAYDIVVDTYVLPNDPMYSYTGPLMNASTTIQVGNYLADYDRTQILYGVTGITGNTASLTGTTGTFAVYSSQSDIVTNQLPMSGIELAFRCPPYIFVDSSVSMSTGGPFPIQNNALALYAFTDAANLQNLFATSARNVQYTTEFGQNSLQPISATFAQPVSPTGLYNTLQNVATTLQVALGNWAQGCTAINQPPSDFVLQELFFNGTTIPTGSFVTMSVRNDLPTASQNPIDEAMAERQRLHFQNSSTIASHGLFGLSYGLDPYLGAPFSKDDVIVDYSNRQSPQTRTMYTSSSTLGFEEDTVFQQVAYKDVNDCIVLAYRANPLFPGAITNVTELSILKPGETCVVMDKILFETRCNEALAAQVHIDEPATIDEVYPLQVSVTRTPNGLQYPGPWRLELQALRSDLSQLSQKFYIDYSLVPVTAKIKASAKAFGFPLVVLDNDHYTWTTDPAISQNTYKILTTSPYRVLTYPIANLNVVDQLNNAIQFQVGTLPAPGNPLDVNALIVRYISGGTFQKPSIQNAVQYATALTEVTKSLADIVPDFAQVSFEARNQQAHATGGLIDEYIFSNVWTLYMIVSSAATLATDVYLFMDDTQPTTSDSPWTNGQQGALNQSQMRSSGLTLGFAQSNDGSLRSMQLLAGTIASLPNPLGNYYNDPIKQPQMQSNFDFVPFHATFGSNNVPVHLPLFFQIAITQPSSKVYEKVLASQSFGSYKVSNGNPLAETWGPVPKAFMEDVVSALLGPSPNVIQQVSAIDGKPFQNLQLLSGLLQYNMGTPSCNGPLPVFTIASQPQDRGSLIQPSQNPDADLIMESYLTTGNTVMNAQTSMYVNRQQLAEAILYAGTQTTHATSGVSAQCAQWAEDETSTLVLRFAGQVLDFTTSARPFAVDATKVNPQPYSLVPQSSLTVQTDNGLRTSPNTTNPTVNHPWPLVHGKEDLRNLYCYNTQGNDVPSNDYDSVAGLPRYLLPWTLSEGASTALLNPIESLAQVSIWTDVDITRPSTFAGQILNQFMGPPESSLSDVPVQNFGGLVPWFPQVSPEQNIGYSIQETLTSGPTTCLDAISAVGSPGCEGIGGAPFVFSVWASQQGNHEFWFRVQIIAGTNWVDKDPNQQIIAEYISERVPLVTDSQNLSAALIKIQTTNIPQMKLPSSARLRFTLQAQLVQPELQQGQPNMQQSQNSVSILTNYDGLSQAGTQTPCESPPSQVVQALLKTPLGPTLVGSSLLDTNYGDVVYTEPSLWKPTDSGTVPYANSYSSFLKADGIMPSTNSMTQTNFSIISDVNVSPSALFDGRFTDYPRIWFHGAAPLESSLPVWDINWGIVRKAGAPVSLSPFGYTSSSSIQFDTASLKNDVFFGIFPESPYMWLTNNGGLSLTDEFANTLIEITNEGFLSPTSKASLSLFNMQDAAGGGFPQKQSPFVPNGDSNGLPTRVPWTSSLANNVTANTNGITIKQTTDITDLSSTLGTTLKTTKSKTLFWPIGHQDGQQLAEAIQKQLNTFIESFQKLKDAVNVDINFERGLQYLTFEVLNTKLLNAKGLAPIEIVGQVELPKIVGLSALDRTKSIGGLTQCGLSLGLRLQKKIQVGRPIALNTQNDQSLLIVEGSNDLIPLVFRPRHTTLPIEVPDLHDTNASGTLTPGSQTLDELAAEIQRQLNAKLERFRYETQTDVPTTLVVQCGTQETGSSPFPVIANFTTATTSAEFSSISAIVQDGFRFLGIGLQGTQQQSLVVSQDGTSWSVLTPLPILSNANIESIKSLQICQGIQGLLQNICAEVYFSENSEMIFSTFDFNEFKVWTQPKLQLQNIQCASANRDDPYLFVGGQSNSQSLFSFAAIRITDNNTVESIPSISTECFAIGQVPNQGAVVFICNESALILASSTESDLTTTAEILLPPLNYTINGASISWSPTLQLFLVTFRSVQPSVNTSDYVQVFDPVNYTWTPWPLIASLNLNFAYPSSIVDAKGTIVLNAVSNTSLVAQFWDITDSANPQIFISSTPNLIINQMIAAQVFLQTSTLAPALFGPNSIEVRVVSRNVPTGTLSNLEFLWCDTNESLFGTVGISYNPDFIGFANKLQQTYSAQTFGFAVQGTLSTLWLGSPVLSPNPILSPSFVNDTLFLQTRNGSLTDNQALIPSGQVGLAFSAADTDFPGGPSAQFSQPGNVQNILPFGPTLTPLYQDLLRTNLGSYQQVDPMHVDQIFQLPLSAFEVQLAQFTNGLTMSKVQKQKASQPLQQQSLAKSIVSDPILFLESGNYSFNIADHVPEDAIVTGLEFFVIGAGGGSAYGIGGGGVGVQGRLNASDHPEFFAKGSFQVIVGEGGRVPHGFPNADSRKVTLDSLGGGSKAQWPGSAGGGSSQIIHGIQDSTTLRDLSLVVLAAGGGGAGCHDSTPGNQDPQIKTSLAGSADHLIGNNANDFPQFSNAQFSSGGQGGVLPLARGGTCAGQLPENAELHNGAKIDPISFSNRTGGQSVQGGGGGGGGFVGGGAGCAVASNARSSTGGGGGRSFFDNLSNVRLHKAKNGNNQRFLGKNEIDVDGTLLQGASGFFETNNASLLNDNVKDALNVPLQKKSEGHSGAVSIRIVQKVPTVVFGCTSTTFYGEGIAQLPEAQYSTTNFPQSSPSTMNGFAVSQFAQTGVFTSPTECYLTQAGIPAPPLFFFESSLWKSTDGGVSFSKLTTNLSTLLLQEARLTYNEDSTNPVVIASGRNPQNTNCLAKSTDFVNWTLLPSIFAPGYALGNFQDTQTKRWYFGGDESLPTTQRIAYTDEVSPTTFTFSTGWTSADLPISVNAIYAKDSLVIAAGQVAGGQATPTYDLAIAQSQDKGLTWNPAKNLSTNSLNGNIFSIAFGNGVFVAAGLSTPRSCTLMFSKDGIYWTASQTQMNVANGISAVVFTGSKFVALQGNLSSSDLIRQAVSSDGNIWTPVSNPQTQNLLVNTVFSNFKYV